MAPGYRNRDRDRNRNRTGYVDHNEYEGLPIRHWRREDITVIPPSSQENTANQNDIWAVELPHGMPKDYHLLPQHSQDLLRAARSGKIYKRPAPVEEEEADVEALLGDKPEKKDDEAKDKGYTAKAWKQIPRQNEGPDIEYLAKRRKGVITLSSKPAPPVATLTKTTVKRIDAAGNEYIQDVVVPHGQQVEGEVISQTVIPDPSATVDPYAVQPTPPRKNRPVSKKKSKAPRGRKKKAAAPTSAPMDIPMGGTIPATGTAEGSLGTNGVKIESSAEAPPEASEDTEMGDGSMAASDDEDGEEGDDNEDDEGSVESPSKPPPPVSPGPFATAVKTIPGFADTPMTGLEFSRPHPMLQTERMKSEGISGSPLKNIALATSALTSPLESPTAAAPFSEFSVASAIQIPVPAAIETEKLNGEMQIETAESAPTELAQPPPEPTIAEATSSAELLREEEEEEEMLLSIVENASNAQIGQPEVEAPNLAPEIPAEPAPTPIIEAPAEPILSGIAEALQQVDEINDPILLEGAEAERQPEHQPEPVPEIQKVEEDDDDDLDLLGGLEKFLGAPGQVAPAPASVQPALEVSTIEENIDTSEPKEIEASHGAVAIEAQRKDAA